MKQKIKTADEYDLLSKWRKQGIIRRGHGVWKKVKRQLNRRFRKEGKKQIEDDLKGL